MFRLPLARPLGHPVSRPAGHPVGRTLARLAQSPARSAAAALVALAASTAQGTWSILLVDLDTGEIALGSATCLTGFDLRENTPVIVTGVGAATAQSFVDTTGRNRVFIRDGLVQGLTPAQILDGLDGFDSDHQTRQYGIIDARGNAATFSGSGAGAWAGGSVGEFEDTHLGRTRRIAYAIQGNVLAGPEVVDAAVAAVIATPGDLAEKLMAGMEASQILGGDGRCSCVVGGPACGAPPPGFDPATDKSSDIAYMMITRAGDTDGCVGLYAALPLAQGVATVDLDGDGRLDVLAGGIDNIAGYRNTSRDGGGFATLALAESVVPGFTGRGQRIIPADFTGDGIVDLAIADSQNARLVVFPASAPAAWDLPPIEFAIGGTPLELTSADFNADGVADLATVVTGVNELRVILSDGVGGLTAAAPIALGDAPTAVVPFAAVGGTSPSLAVSVGSSTVRLFAGDGAGGFVASSDLALGDRPRGLAAADFDGDGHEDLAVSDDAGTGSVTLLWQEADGSFTQQEIATPNLVRLVLPANVDGDALPDLIAVTNRGGPDFSVLQNLGNRQFDLTSGYLDGGIHAIAADLNGDGRDDVIAGRSGRGVNIQTNIGGRFMPIGFYASGEGCGAGDHYMNFNIANQSRIDPDPVLQLRGEFGLWRADLVGQPDAIASEVQTPVLIADGVDRGEMIVTLRDWQGAAAGLPGLGLIVHHATGSDRVSTVGGVSDLGGGVFSVELLASLQRGTDRYEIIVVGGDRPVTLMPEAVVVSRIGTGDYNGDGVIDSRDVLDFFDDFIAGNPGADLNGDGLFSGQDFFLLLSLIGR